MKTDLYVNGAWRATPRRFAVANPATGERIADVADASPDDVRAAIDAAAAAFPAWAALPARDRSAPLFRLRDLMLARQEELARLVTTEGGKPLAEARSEVAYADDFVGWYAEEAKRAYGETVPASAPNKRILVLRQPVGVVAAITPWNFPLAMITRKVSPALAAGCTVVVKPPRYTPLSALAIAELVHEAAFPPGVVNVVTARESGPVGDVLLSDPRVRKIAFTGSTEVGRELMRRAADQVKRVSLELGGNAPVILFDDADLDDALPRALSCKFRNAGQTCICANRIFAQRGIYDRVASSLAERIRGLRLGDGLAEGTEIGPVIDEAALAKAERLVQDAVAKGAKLVVGGRRLPRKGTFFEPTLLVDVTDDMAVAREELFLPIAPLLRFDAEDEVVRRANDTPYGLAAYFFTRDMRRAVRVAERLEYGMVGVNDTQISTAQAPFGGMKQSGIGREGGKWGLEEFLEVKYVSWAV